MKSKEIQDIYQALENFEMRLTRLEDIMIGKQDETETTQSSRRRPPSQHTKKNQRSRRSKSPKQTPNPQKTNDPGGKPQTLCL